MREQRAGREGSRTRTTAFTVALATSLAVAAPALAQDAPPDLPAFGMIGLAERQVAILNLVLVGPPDDSHPGCRVTASFVDRRGQVFRDAAGNPVQETFVLRPQIAAMLRLRAEDILADGQRRRPTRAVLTPPPDDSTPSDCTCLVASREIVGADGGTSTSDYGQRTGGGGNPPPPVCLATTTPR